MQAPSPSELQDGRRFECVLRVAHRDLGGFVERWLHGEATAMTRAHHALTGLAGLALVVCVLRSRGGAAEWAIDLASGAVIAIGVLLPLHEITHAAGYLALGARDVRWHLSWRPFAAYVVAHRFVTRRRAFTAVALLPSAALGLALALAAVAWPPVRVIALAALLVHHLGSAGDFALADFARLQPAPELFAHDDADLGVTSFWRPRAPCEAPPGALLA